MTVLDSISLDQKAWVPRLGEIITPHGTLSTNVYACRGLRQPLDNRQKSSRKWVGIILASTYHLWLRQGWLSRKSRRTASIHELGPANFDRQWRFSSLFTSGYPPMYWRVTQKPPQRLNVPLSRKMHLHQNNLRLDILWCPLMNVTSVLSNPMIMWRKIDPNGPAVGWSVVLRLTVVLWSGLFGIVSRGWIWGFAPSVCPWSGQHGLPRIFYRWVSPRRKPWKKWMRCLILQTLARTASHWEWELQTVDEG